jgi:hypothetical protein
MKPTENTAADCRNCVVWSPAGKNDFAKYSENAA